RKQPSIGQTKKLLLAALRLWELKNGYPRSVKFAPCFSHSPIQSVSAILRYRGLHNAEKRVISSKSRSTRFPQSLGASEATICSKRGSPRSGSQMGCSFRRP